MSETFQRDSNDAQKEKIKLLLNYDKNNSPRYQAKIASFFKAQKDNLKLKTCYFCNIDYINAFDDIGDYHDGMDFIKRATDYELPRIKGVGKAALRKIRSQRYKVATLKDFKLPSSTEINIEKLTLKELHSHFTLDHVLDKATHPLLALSLYNFVPSCYACNCKFKGCTPIVRNMKEIDLSPTSSRYSVDQNVTFQLLYTSSTKLADISSSNDFVVNVSYCNNVKKYKNYMNTFKLASRYSTHKDEALVLIKKKATYSNSRMKEIAATMGISLQQVKQDLYGKNLFEGNPEDKSMTKFQRDIARDIGIKGVKK